MFFAWRAGETPCIQPDFLAATPCPCLDLSCEGWETFLADITSSLMADKHFAAINKDSLESAAGPECPDGGIRASETLTLLHSSRSLGAAVLPLPSSPPTPPVYPATSISLQCFFSTPCPRINQAGAKKRSVSCNFCEISTSEAPLTPGRFGDENAQGS